MTIQILMTGVTGYLGSRIAHHLLATTDVQLICLKRSFSKLDRIQGIIDKIGFYNLDEIDLLQIFEKHKIDVILHCATNYGRNNDLRSKIVEANLLMPLQLLECASSFGVQAFINTDTILDKRISYYTLSKNQFCDWLRAFSSEMLCINVALEHFFGPGDDPSKFVSFIISQLLRGVDYIPLTNGEQKRDFIYIDDVVAAFEHIVKFAIKPETPHYGYEEFQVGSGRSIPLREFVLLAKEIAGNNTTKLKFGALPYRANEVMDSHVDLKRITMLGWHHKIELRDGLQNTIAMERRFQCQHT